MTTNDEIADRLQKAAVAAVQLTAARVGTPLSKIGGLPDLPQQFEWPAWKGSPLAFLAQIELGSVPALHSLTDLPRTGMLYFLYNQKQSTWGFDPADRGSWRVIYLAASQDLATATPPEGLSKKAIYKQKPVEPRQINSYPSFERLYVDLRSVPDEAFEIEEELRSEATGDEPEHQIGGFPNPVQGDEMERESQLVSNGIYCGDPSGYQDPRAAELEDGVADWKLLLQVDTDDDTGMMWGDGGRLYFWIRTGDLASNDFSNVWMVLQCH